MPAQPIPVPAPALPCPGLATPHHAARGDGRGLRAPGELRHAGTDTPRDIGSAGQTG